jgi:hypothetical protein
MRNEGNRERTPNPLRVPSGSVNVPPRRQPQPAGSSSSIPIAPVKPLVEPKKVPRLKQIRKIRVPRVSLIGKRFLKLSKRRRILIIIIFIIVIVVIVRIILALHETNNSVSLSKSGTGLSLTDPSLPKGTPSYSTIIPNNKSIDKLGGWTRVSPVTSNPVYAYVDSIGSIPISVSEQPLPSSFKSNSATQVQNLAKNFNASESFYVGSLKVYIGTSVSGPQSLIFTTDNLLVLIKSSAQITTQKWTSYIATLQ